MNKNDINNYLHQLTEREKLYKNNQVSESMDDYSDFEVYTNASGDSVFKYTFEKHLQKAIDSNRHISTHLHTSPLLVFKHNRYAYTPLHSHDFIEINYVYSGQAHITIDDTTLILEKGDLCILDTDVVHRISNTSDSDILVNILMKKEYFSSNMLNRLASNNIISEFAVRSISETHSHDQYIVFTTDDSEILQDAISGLLVYYLDPVSYSLDAINAYMIIIFSELLKSYTQKKSLECRSTNQQYIGDVLQYIEKNYATCSLTDVATHFNFNASYLSRYLKKQTGTTFMKMIQDIRLNHACALLKNSTYSIEEICQQIGYRNLTFFYKKFTETFHCTPKKYRNSYRKIVEE
ncbi:AraC family transcriptional regulator [Paenilisteria rocourtiae]|uniref:AraC-like DNA-binding protein n=1 Tax=Listeria rocourtiae TaxID=647910 RepID=A0A4R6ZRZ2_9LIST|nr:AraC family transcriptional regulator [Listeria rocourtiae]EUJ52377.1 AraC family transcriptional regulator [Listeria rocourtiae FSL F6-920]MBC1434715.1 AraC family transcriptional regulator [Listeria rocourtiae]MBC1603407.1 AraC family transcriptional regulator [Listeria rocourtiae]TDR55308.1 AraC-like DNA-binding protein [Listeria rocourtiae]